jgi:hypothetical protein
LTATKTPFTLERTAGVPPGVVSAPKSTKAHLEGDAVVLETALELDYWEVDPDWDGVTFRSAVQARRPVRSDDVPCRLKIRAGSKVCIRLVTAQGQQYQLDV